MRNGEAGWSHRMGIAETMLLRWRFPWRGATMAPRYAGPAMTESTLPTCRFQSFSEPSDPAEVAGRVAALRGALASQGLAGFVIPRADEHQGEYVPGHMARLAWLTGFTGSAGSAVVLADKAALIVDGRYTIQSAA